MQRREFSIKTTSAMVAGSSGMLSGAVQAQGAKPVEGIDFLTLDKPAMTEAAGKIEVVEFFWYSCQHCNRFEPQLDEWVKRLPSDVVLRRAPVAFRPDFEPQQRLYFALEALGKVAELHKKVFYAIHVEKQPLATFEPIADWVEKQGVNKAKFAEAYNSFPVATKVRKSNLLQEAFKLDGVPSLGVAGKYFTSGSIAQNMERALLVTDYLVGLARASLPAAKAEPKKVDKSVKAAKPAKPQ